VTGTGSGQDAPSSAEAARQALAEVAAADGELQDAFDRVIDATDVLMEAAVSADDRAGAAIHAAISAILEAAAMRDIVGQRLANVRDAIRVLGGENADSVGAGGTDPETKRDKAPKIEEKMENGSASEAGLLNGPSCRVRPRAKRRSTRCSINSTRRE
jgi:chemotaxis protein CheZ